MLPLRPGRQPGLVNFEGLALDTKEAAEELARAAEARFFQILRDHERRYLLSTTRYSTDVFMRRGLGRDFADAKLSQRMYRSFEEATRALADGAARR